MKVTVTGLVVVLVSVPVIFPAPEAAIPVTVPVLFLVQETAEPAANPVNWIFVIEFPEQIV